MTGIDASLSFFSTSQRWLRNRSPSRLPVSPMYNLLHNAQVIHARVNVIYAPVNVLSECGVIAPD